MARLTSKKVEEKGLRIFKEYFEECDRVDTYVPSNDKEPLWDGHLYLFNSSEQKAEQIYGRIPTQLKSASKVSQKSIVTFPVKRASLETYKRDGGIAFYYVLVDNPASKQIYYCLLTPVKIKKYLRAPSKGNSITVTLQQLPTDKNQITEELFQFYFDCKKQTSSSDKPIVELKDFFEGSGTKQFTIFANTPKPVDDLFRYIQSHSLYLYATDDNNNILYALGDEPGILKIGRDIKLDIAVNGVNYFNGCTIYEEEGKRVVTIGDFFTVYIDDIAKKGSFNFKFKNHSNINKIPALAFCLDIIKQKQFSIGQLKISCSSIDIDKKTIDLMQEELKILCQVRSLFNVMHIESDINLDELSPVERQNLGALYRGIVLKEPLNLNDGMEKRVRFSIGPLVLYVIFEATGSGTYYVRDFFMDSEACGIMEEEDTITKTSRFSLPSVEQFAEASNFDYSTMIDSYEQLVKEDERIAEFAHNDMIKLLLAFDKTGGEKTKLLDAAEALNNWFIVTHRFCESPLNVVNRLQILKRRRNLTEEENGILFEILDSEVTEDYKTACMLLLDNQKGADYHFKKIPDESKAFFKSLPIYHFWK